jgi:hypothetical protein
MATHNRVALGLASIIAAKATFAWRGGFHRLDHVMGSRCVISRARS